MAATKKPEDIRPQRITQRNIEIIEKYGKPKTGESFNDVLTRVLDDYESMKKRRESK